MRAALLVWCLLVAGCGTMAAMPHAHDASRTHNAVADRETAIGIARIVCGRNNPAGVSAAQSWEAVPQGNDWRVRSLPAGPGAMEIAVARSDGRTTDCLTSLD